MPLIKLPKKKRCIYCNKFRPINELERIQRGIYQCPEHDKARPGTERKGIRYKETV